MSHKPRIPDFPRLVHSSRSPRPAEAVAPLATLIEENLTIASKLTQGGYKADNPGSSEAQTDGR
jgi:hypothetical protein